MPSERLARGRRGVIGLDHRLDRDLDLEVELLAHAGVDDPAGAVRADHEAADLLERPLGRRQADALHVGAGSLAQSLERQREMGAALGRGDRVDLVDDHPAGALEQLLGASGQHQVQRLGSRDQDVGRLAEHPLTLALRRVPGPDRDLELGSDPAQRRAQVAVDVVGEGLERRHVDEARATLLGVARAVGIVGELIDRVQERGQRLARPGRG